MIRRAIRYFALGTFYIIASPMGFSAKGAHRLFGTSLIFDFFAQSLSLVPGALGKLMRACFYKQTLRRSHLDLDMAFGSFVSKINTAIGKGVLISGRTTIGFAEIGDGAVIANYVSILSGRYQHNFKDPGRKILDNTDTFSMVKIGSETFIGDHCVVMADIGEKSIIGAGSVVVKEIPNHAVAVGCPAKVVKTRK